MTDITNSDSNHNHFRTHFKLFYDKKRKEATIFLYFCDIMMLIHNEIVSHVTDTALTVYLWCFFVCKLHQSIGSGTEGNERKNAACVTSGEWKNKKRKKEIKSFYLQKKKKRKKNKLLFHSFVNFLSPPHWKK